MKLIIQSDYLLDDISNLCHNKITGEYEIKIVKRNDLESYINELDKSEDVILCDGKFYPRVIDELDVKSIDFNKITRFSWYSAKGFISGKSHLILSYLKDTSVSMKLIRYKMIDIDILNPEDKKVIEVADFLSSNDERVRTLKSCSNENLAKSDDVLDMASSISGFSTDTVKGILESFVTALKLKLLEEVDCNLENENLNDIILSVGSLGQAYIENGRLVISDLSNRLNTVNDIQNNSIRYLEKNLVDLQVQRFLKKLEAGEISE